MAAKTSILDRFFQSVRLSIVIPLNVTTGNITKVPSNWNPKDKLGMLIEETQWNFDATRSNMDAITDQARYGLAVVSAQPATGLTYSTSGVIEFNTIGTQYGTLVGSFDNAYRVKNNYKDKTGAGLLCHPASLYVWTWNSGAAALAADVTLTLDIKYTLIELTPEDWQEMWQLGYIVGTV